MIMILALQLASTTTTCNSYGGTVTCNTQQQGASPAQDNWLMDLATNKQGQQFQAARQQAQDDADEGARNRRAAAYAKVGDLIAAGDCAGAKRLAKFYNHPDIMADTAKACP